MLKLYAVLYVMGKLAYSVGPWPDDTMEDCQRAIEQTKTMVAEEFNGKDTIEDGGVTYKREDFTPQCRVFGRKPVLGESIDADTIR